MYRVCQKKNIVSHELKSSYTCNFILYLVCVTLSLANTCYRNDRPILNISLSHTHWSLKLANCRQPQHAKIIFSKQSSTLKVTEISRYSHTHMHNHACVNIDRLTSSFLLSSSSFSLCCLSCSPLTASEYSCSLSCTADTNVYTIGMPVFASAYWKKTVYEAYCSDLPTNGCMWWLYAMLFYTCTPQFLSQLGNEANWNLAQIVSMQNRTTKKFCIQNSSCVKLLCCLSFFIEALKVMIEILIFTQRKLQPSTWSTKTKLSWSIIAV